MAVFYDLDKLPIYDPDTLRAEYICVKANTVIIENALIDTQRDTILRFTMGHEAGHLTLDQQYYSISKGQRSLFDSENISCVKCKRAYIETNFSLKTDIDWMEWQANYFSAALLMPKPAMQNILSNITGYSIDSQIEIIKDTFNVSKQAAEIRIRQLLSKEKIDPAQAVLF